MPTSRPTASMLVAAFQEGFDDIASNAPVAASQLLGLIVRIYKGAANAARVINVSSYHPPQLHFKLVACILVYWQHG